MCSDCPWLPAMAQVSPWQHGGSDDTYDMLYGIFQRDFVESRPHYCGQEVWHFPEKEDGKEILFWHLTSRKVDPKPMPRRMQRYSASIQQYAQRYPDLRRSERLPWVRPLIENSQQPQVLAWDYVEGTGDTHTYVWLKDMDFVVIMKKYRDGRRRLITSFYVDQDYKNQDFERKYSNRVV
jgi:hypothetical protein